MLKNINKQDNYNHEENVAAIKQDIQYIRSTNIEYAIRIGKRLILANENVPHGKWYETLDEIGFSPDKAERLVKIAITFGDNPSLLEGMTQQKALLLATLPDENLIQLKQDEIFIASDGTVYTLGEIQEMTGKEFENKLLNLRNQKNKEISDWRSRALTAEAEMKEMRTESKAREQFLKKFMAEKIRQ